MIRKLILPAFLLVFISTGASAYTHVTPCGKKIQTVSPDFFENEADAKAWYAEIDKDECGVVDTEDQDPVENPEQP